MNRLFIGTVRCADGYRPPITVRAGSIAEARKHLEEQYPGDAVEAVVSTNKWPDASDTGTEAGDVREHHAVPPKPVPVEE